MPRDSSWNTAVVSARVQQLVDAGVVERDRGRCRCGARPSAARRRLMIASAQSMIVSVRRPRKSNFTRPTLLDVVLVELRHEAAAGVVDVQRHEIGERGRRDHHAAGVLADVARDAFELEGHLHDLGDLLVLLDEVAQRLLLLHGLLERHADLEGNQLRELVGHAVGLALHARHVAHHGLRRHGAEGDDLATPRRGRRSPPRRRSRGRALPCRSRCRSPASRPVRGSGSARTADRTAADRGR